MAALGRWMEHVLASRAQSLDDVALARMSTVAVLAGDLPHAALCGALERDALKAGFAFATCSLAKANLHELHIVVRELASGFRVPGVTHSREHGLLSALERFAKQHGEAAPDDFERACEEASLSGELRVLARDAIAGMSGRSSRKRLSAWLGGDLPAKSAEELSLRPLNARSAKRALSQLTRLSGALGHRGIRIVLTDAESLVDLSPARREVAYTVLRELIDNADGGQGMLGCELLLVGRDALLNRKASLASHPALASRLVTWGAFCAPIPHQTLVPLSAQPTFDELSLPAPPPTHTTDARRRTALRSLVRLAQGLPPIEAVPELTVGMDTIDARIEKLFAHAANDGSVFTILSGEYGSGKTHHLMHLEARALADERPVLRLSVERLDEDLGNPQRHLRRLLEGGVLPLRRHAGPLDRLDSWLSTEAARKRLHVALSAVAAEGGEASKAAERALRGDGDKLSDAAVLETLGAIDLESKPSNPGYRKDAYARLLLWLELLARLEGCEGPVVILDEAENLYRAGVSRPERRTALRSLAFYCSGSLPRACVVLAVTPETLASLQEEADALLAEIEDQATLLPSEDVAMLRSRLRRSKPIHVTRLDRNQLRTLARQAHELAKKARGRIKDDDWEPFLKQAIAEASTPRELLRRIALRTERAWWERS